MDLPAWGLCTQCSEWIDITKDGSWEDHLKIHPHGDDPPTLSYGDITENVDKPSGLDRWVK